MSVEVVFSALGGTVLGIIVNSARDIGKNSATLKENMLRMTIAVEEIGKDLKDMQGEIATQVSSLRSELQSHIQGLRDELHNHKRDSDVRVARVETQVDEVNRRVDIIRALPENAPPFVRGRMRLNQEMGCYQPPNNEQG